ncbi:MAG: DNA mismatch repair protein MutT [Bacteroidales bacterium]
MTTHYNPHLSVDCVLIGFNGEELKILLVQRNESDASGEFNDMKLPGRLIYEKEELDDAAYSVLQELTGIQQPYLRQFKTFGSVSRTADPKDVRWLENAVKLKIGRLVTVAYMSLIRITSKLNTISAEYSAGWQSLKDLPQLAFDHNQIIQEAKQEIQRSAQIDPTILFELLPSRFTALQLRRLYEEVYDKPLDVRNFHKKIMTLPYIVPLNEYEKAVAHRAARYYKFDKKRILKV